MVENSRILKSFASCKRGALEKIKQIIKKQGKEGALEEFLQALIGASPCKVVLLYSQKWELQAVVVIINKQIKFFLKDGANKLSEKEIEKVKKF